MRTVIAHPSHVSGRIRSTHAYRMAVRAARRGCTGSATGCPLYGQGSVVQRGTIAWPAALQKRFCGGMPLRSALRPDSGACRELPSRCPRSPAVRLRIQRRAGGRSGSAPSPARCREDVLPARDLHKRSPVTELPGLPAHLRRAGRRPRRSGDSRFRTADPRRREVAPRTPARQAPAPRCRTADPRRGLGGHLGGHLGDGALGCPHGTWSPRQVGRASRRLACRTDQAMVSPC